MAIIIPVIYKLAEVAITPISMSLLIRDNQVVIRKLDMLTRVDRA
jgi:hypothetical protein